MAIEIPVTTERPTQQAIVVDEVTTQPTEAITEEATTMLILTTPSGAQVEIFTETPIHEADITQPSEIIESTEHAHDEQIISTEIPPIEFHITERILTTTVHEEVIVGEVTEATTSTTPPSTVQTTTTEQFTTSTPIPEPTTITVSTEMTTTISTTFIPETETTTEDER